MSVIEDPTDNIIFSNKSKSKTKRFLSVAGSVTQLSGRMGRQSATSADGPPGGLAGQVTMWWTQSQQQQTGGRALLTGAMEPNPPLTTGVIQDAGTIKVHG